MATNEREMRKLEGVLEGYAFLLARLYADHYPDVRPVLEDLRHQAVSTAQGAAIQKVCGLALDLQKSRIDI